MTYKPTELEARLDNASTEYIDGIYFAKGELCIVQRFEGRLLLVTRACDVDEIVVPALMTGMERRPCASAFHVMAVALARMAYEAALTGREEDELTARSALNYALLELS